MFEKLWRWAAWIQVAALIGGGMMISAASTRTWLGHGTWSQAGTSLGEGQIALALGGVAVALGTARIIFPGRATRITTVILGLWLSIAVIMLTVVTFKAGDQYPNLLSYVPPRELGPGLYNTLYGGIITGVGSLFGLAPADPEPPPWPPRQPRAPPPSSAA